MPVKATALGNNIRSLRHRHGFSIEDLALNANLNPHAIRKIESGERANPRIDTMIKLANALGLTLDVLAGR